MAVTAFTPAEVQEYNIQLPYVDNILMVNGLITPTTAAAIRDIPSKLLAWWCRERGVYGIPSWELVYIIKQYIPDCSKFIEVGGGNGVFGRALDIPSTDSMIQNTPEMQLYYSMLGQATTQYGANVEHIEASDAIDKYTPDVVFGSWVTQYVSPMETNIPDGGGSMYGLREDEFINKISTYIVYGNDAVHGKKELFKRKDLNVGIIRDTDNFFSRAMDHTLNALYIVTHK